MTAWLFVAVVVFFGLVAWEEAARQLSRALHRRRLRKHRWFQ